MADAVFQVGKLRLRTEVLWPEPLAGGKLPTRPSNPSLPFEPNISPVCPGYSKSDADPAARAAPRSSLEMQSPPGPRPAEAASAFSQNPQRSPVGS